MEENQGVDGLRRTLDIEWQRLVIIVSGSAVGQKKCSFPILVSSVQFFVKTRVACAYFIVLEAVQHIRRVETVDPAHVRTFAVVPGGIRPLMISGVLHGLLRQAAIGLVSRVRIGSG